MASAHFPTVDADWFKKRQRQLGVTSFNIGEALNRDRSVVSKILTGRQRMSLDHAKAFAKVLDVTLAEVLERAGIADTATAQSIAPGFSDSDAARWVPKSDADPGHEISKALGADRPGVDVWAVKSDALILQGYLPGDLMIVDTHASERCGSGDVVIAQINNWQTGEANTILRRYEPPVLVAANSNAGGTWVHVVDNNNVVIRGKVISSWRH